MYPFLNVFSTPGESCLACSSVIAALWVHYYKCNMANIHHDNEIIGLHNPANGWSCMQHDCCQKKIFGDALVGLKIGRLIGLIMFLLVILRLTFDIRQGWRLLLFGMEWNLVMLVFYLGMWLPMHTRLIASIGNFTKSWSCMAMMK